jgi:hypothetical protein
MLTERGRHHRPDPAGAQHLAGQRHPDRRAPDDLAALPDDGFRLTTLPAPARGMGSFPIRAVAVLPATS